MNQFNTYFTEKEIIRHICKLRIKIAKSRNKKHLIHLLTNSDKYNYHIKDKISEENNEFIKYQYELNKKLSQILPPRKKWVKLGYKSRMKWNSTEKLSSNDKNFYSLLKTIKLYKKNNPKVDWLLELELFIKDIQLTIKNENLNIKTPLIFPKPKEDKISENKTNSCRPISIFPLKERIILSISNKFLTKLFDDYFQDSSYAFRSKKNKDNTSVLSHHDCIKDIISYQKKNSYNPLYVVECDMEKFYDSVNHKVVQKLFNNLIQVVKKDNIDLELTVVERIFKEYLNCYAFNKNVPKENDLEYWNSYRIPKGKFGWIENRLLDLKYYSNIDSERIGVPQGGALSGLIANIILNEADKNVLKTNVFYIRFCDDMLIMHRDFNECEKAKVIYTKTLEKLKLVPHQFITKLTERKDLTTISLKPFWHTKSKGAYKWGSIENKGFPWISFVGYEIHHKGNIRVRKKSLEKELRKQKKIVNEIEKAVEFGQRKVKGYVVESTINRLIGMSVGRIGLNNYDEISTDMCWKNGFKELSLNKDSTKQIKQLDRSRSKLYYDLLKTIKNPKKNKKDDDEDDIERKRQIIFYDKPFSYYYQVLERNKKKRMANKT